MFVENTIPAIQEGMQTFDGIETDVRLTIDKKLVLFHDRKLHPSAIAELDGSKYVESHTLEELKSVGIPSLEEVFQHNRIGKRWQNEAKFLDIEFKLPYPGAKLTKGWFSTSGPRAHLAEMYHELDYLLTEYNIPTHNVATIGFSEQLLRARKKANCTHIPSSIIRPCIQPWGGPLVERVRSFPAYTLNPFSRSLTKAKKEDSPLIPMALNYLLPISRRIVFGRPIGIRGKAAKRFMDKAKGFSVHVFPSRLDLEWDLYDLGVTTICDQPPSESEVDSSGKARWLSPATRPLSLDEERQLRSLTNNEAIELRQDFLKEIPSWSELDSNERRKHLLSWSKRWNWSRSINQLELESEDNRLPREAVRIIGHRGNGLTGRPIPRLK